MTTFWRLFISAYVQDFIDSVSIPTSDHIIEIFIGSDFENVFNSHKKQISSLLEQIPSAQEIFSSLKESTIVQLKKNA